MVNKKELTISKIKKDVSSNGKEFYKLFFKEIKHEEQEKVFFLWPNNTVPYEMIKEEQFKEGDKVNIDYDINKSGQAEYWKITGIGRFISDRSPASKKGVYGSGLDQTW